MKVKSAARQDLTTALGELRKVSDATKPTEEQLKQALAAYRKAIAKYRSEVEAQDKGLAAKLSLASQARCLALGVLDNGLGASGMRRPRTDGGGGMGRM